MQNQTMLQHYKIMKLELKKEYHAEIAGLAEPGTASTYKPYKKPNFIVRAFRTVAKTLVLKPYMFFTNKFSHKLKIYGRDNLKNLRSAIVVCNHVEEKDYIAVIKALSGHKIAFASPLEGSQHKQLNKLSKAIYELPTTNQNEPQQAFDERISGALGADTFVVFYPEKSLWNKYKKPRPHLNEAYDYAVKNTVPMLPLFITFGEKKNGKSNMNVHILSPLTPNLDNPHTEEVQILKSAVMNHMISTYEVHYEKTLGDTSYLF